MRRFGLLAVLAVSGCVNVPELGESVPDGLRDAPYPALVPLETALAQSPPPGRAAREIGEGVNARVARLQARADRLRGPVLDDGSRVRMQTATRQGQPDIAPPN